MVADGGQVLSAYRKLFNGSSTLSIFQIDTNAGLSLGCCKVLQCWFILWVLLGCLIKEQSCREICVKLDLFNCKLFNCTKKKKSNFIFPLCVWSFGRKSNVNIQPVSFIKSDQNQHYELSLCPQRCCLSSPKKTKHIQTTPGPPPIHTEACTISVTCRTKWSIFENIVLRAFPSSLNLNRVFLGQQPTLIIESPWSCWEKQWGIFSWSHALREEDGTHLHPPLLKLIQCYMCHFLLLLFFNHQRVE